MVYSNGYVISIIYNGNIIPEKKDGTVLLPFNAEYKIRLRNKTNKRAVAKIFIDDEIVSSHGGYIVDNQNYIDIVRFYNENKSFKFVSLKSHEAKIAGKTSNRDGSKGVIKVEFYPEKDKSISIRPDYPKPYPYYPWVPPYQPVKYTSYNCCSTYNTRNIIRDGCTVKGHQTDQSFYSILLEIENIPTVLQLILKGTNQPIKIRKYCENCGTSRIKNTARFCYSCGDKFEF